MNWLLYFLNLFSLKEFGDSPKFDLPPAKEGVKNLGNSPSPSPRRGEGEPVETKLKFPPP
jgi:hypothetical protein